ncbi:hypothetical protein QTP88_004519 [Uroleucon formosanum]
MIQMTVTSTQDIRDNYQHILIISKELCKKWNIPVTYPNERKKQAVKYFDEIDGDRRLNTNEDNFKVQIFFPVMDSVLSQLVARFKGTHEVVETFSFLNPTSFLSKTEKEVVNASYDFILKYSNDISTDFTRQLLSLRTSLQKHQLKTIKSLAIYIVENDLSIVFPDVLSACVIFITIPITVAEAERSFSKLKIIKNYLRNSMSQNRLNKMILAKELHKPVRKKFPKRRIFTKGIDDLWAADLVIMRNYSDENKGYSYIITVIDTFSKFSWALELKKKDGINVSEAFEKIIKQAISQNHQAPKLLHADKGLEFENKHFKKVLQKYGIKMYHTQNEEKSSIIERFNRTLNSKMRLHFEVTNSKKWIKILKSLIYEYNFKDIHRSIGMRPCEVNKSNEDVVFHKLFSTKNKTKLKIKFSVGDKNVKYNLNKIPIEGNILIISQGDVDFGNGKPYVSKLLHSPTWLELCKIANEQIIATGDYNHYYLDSIKFIQDLGNIKMCEFFMGS